MNYIGIEKLSEMLEQEDGCFEATIKNEIGDKRILQLLNYKFFGEAIHPDVVFRLNEYCVEEFNRMIDSYINSSEDSFFIIGFLNQTNDSLTAHEINFLLIKIITLNEDEAVIKSSDTNSGEDNTPDKIIMRFSDYSVVYYTKDIHDQM